MKKAMELSILCNCQISLVIFNSENQLFEYCSTDPRFILQRYCQVALLPHEKLTNQDYNKFDKTGRLRTKGSKEGGSGDGDDDDQDEESNDSFVSSGMIKDEGANSQGVYQQQSDTALSPRSAAIAAAFADPNSFAMHPNAIEEMTRLVQQGNINPQQAAMMANIMQQRYVQQVQYQQLQMQQQMNQQQLMNNTDSQGTTEEPPSSQENELKRREMEPSSEAGNDDFPSPKRRKSDLTIQVPSSKSLQPMKQFEEEQVASLPLEQHSFQEPNPIQMTIKNHAPDVGKEEPVVYSPFTSNSDQGVTPLTPLHLSSSLDWRPTNSIAQKQM